MDGFIGFDSLVFMPPKEAKHEFESLQTEITVANAESRFEDYQNLKKEYSEGECKFSIWRTMYRNMEIYTIASFCKLNYNVVAAITDHVDINSTYFSVIFVGPTGEEEETTLRCDESIFLDFIKKNYGLNLL